jgi:hypothetical protein
VDIFLLVVCGLLEQSLEAQILYPTIPLRDFGDQIQFHAFTTHLRLGYHPSRMSVMSINVLLTNM